MEDGARKPTTREPDQLHFIESPTDMNPSLYLLGAIIILGLFALVRFVVSRIALMDRVRRQCPHCGGDETCGSRKEKDSSVFTYHCRLCDHAWPWDQTTPYPEVTVRPELIAAGKARLAQEQRDDRGSHGGPANIG